MKTFLKKMIGSVLLLAVLAGMAAVPTAALDISEKYPTDESSPLKDLTICFYGDSVCSANCERDTEYADIRGWAGRIGAVTGCTFYNFGVSGASVSDCRGANTILTQLKQTKSQGINPDVIVLHGGVNDAWDAIEVGEISPSFASYSKFNPSTFAPALEQVIAYAEDTFPDAEICYVINFEFLNANMGERLMDMDEYVDATIEICDKWYISYLDLYHDTALVNALHPHTVSASGAKQYQNTYLYDFVHPSTEGYDLLYVPILKFLEELIAPTPKPKPEPQPEPQPEPEAEPEQEVKGEEGSELENEVQQPTEEPKQENTIAIILGATAASPIAVAIAVIMLCAKNKNKKTKS